MEIIILLPGLAPFSANCNKGTIGANQNTRFIELVLRSKFKLFGV